MWSRTTQTPSETQALGRALALVASPGVVVALRGTLGAGKTCFAQGVGEGLGILDPILSPTFVLVAEYVGRLPLLHADLYRLEPDEVPQIGLDEQIAGWPGIVLVEWAERAPDLLPDDQLVVTLEEEGPGRRIVAEATGPRHRAVLAAWRESAGT
jgi:tRNA threonylcarbamoyladenosine biosynthesis protein TsaE